MSEVERLNDPFLKNRFVAALTRASIRFGIRPVEAKRFVKFMVVGAIGFIVDFGFFNLLVGPFSHLVDPGRPLYEILTGYGLDPDLVIYLGPTFASIFSFIAAVVSNFLWNRYWTYPDSRSRSKRRQFIMFLLVSVIGISIRIPIITLLFPPFTNFFELFPLLAPYAERLGSNAALAVAVVIVLFWNFFANRFWTYGDVD